MVLEDPTEEVAQSALGRFLQTDPIEGGSANDYDYCNADPINCTDLSGEAAGSWGAAIRAWMQAVERNNRERWYRAVAENARKEAAIQLYMQNHMRSATRGRDLPGGSVSVTGSYVGAVSVSVSFRGWGVSVAACCASAGVSASVSPSDISQGWTAGVSAGVCYRACVGGSYGGTPGNASFSGSGGFGVRGPWLTPYVSYGGRF